MKSILALIRNRSVSHKQKFAVCLAYLIAVTVVGVMLFCFAPIRQSVLAADCYSGSGCLDSSFNGTGKVFTPTGVTNSNARAVALQADGKIVVAGYSIPTSNTQFTVARYYSDGSLDASFGSGGVSRVELTPVLDAEMPAAVKIQSDGKIVVVGRVQSTSAVLRLNTDGTVDNTFGTGGIVLTDFGIGTQYAAEGLVIQSNGKIVLCGGVGTAFGFVRLNTDGSLDTSFGTGGKAKVAWGSKSTAIAHDLTIQVVNNSEMIVAVGEATPSKTSDFAVVRLTPSGVLDSSFASGGKFSTDFYGSTDNAYGVAIDANNSIVVSGRAGILDRGNTLNLNMAAIRLTTNGALDSSFNNSGKVAVDILGGRDEALSLGIQTDGKIVLGGSVWNATGADPDFVLVRFAANGSLDNSFGSGGITMTDLVAADQSFDLAIQADGKIILVGYAKLFVGSTISQWAIARYLP